MTQATHPEPLDTSFHDHEMAIETSDDRRFARWISQAERLLGAPKGCDLDGTEGRDGYSLDSASDAFDAGITPQQYADGARA